jgi:hypothetical protein
VALICPPGAQTGGRSCGPREQARRPQSVTAVRARSASTSTHYTYNDRTHGVQPPAQLAAARGHEQAKRVNKQVVPVVLPQNLDLAGRLAKGVAVSEQCELDAECGGDCGQRRDVERVVIRVRNE